jgi:hypothetical protein
LAIDGDGNISFLNIGLFSISVSATNHQHCQLKAASITQLLLCHQMDARLSLLMKVTLSPKGCTLIAVNEGNINKMH